MISRNHVAVCLKENSIDMMSFARSNKLNDIQSECRTSGFSYQQKNKIIKTPFIIYA
jgi:hypothetical protein